jgi:hypothetical protein
MIIHISLHELIWEQRSVVDQRGNVLIMFVPDVEYDK